MSVMAHFLEFFTLFHFSLTFFDRSFPLILTVHIILTDTCNVLGKTPSLAEWAGPYEAIGLESISYRYKGRAFTVVSLG